MNDVLPLDLNNDTDLLDVLKLGLNNDSELHDHRVDAPAKVLNSLNDVTPLNQGLDSDNDVTPLIQG